MPIRRARCTPDRSIGSGPPNSAAHAGAIGRDAPRLRSLGASGAPPRWGPLAVEASLPCGPYRGDALILAGTARCLAAARGALAPVDPGSVSNPARLPRAWPEPSLGPFHTIGGASVSRASDPCGCGPAPFPRRGPVSTGRHPFRPIFPLKALRPPGCLESRPSLSIGRPLSSQDAAHAIRCEGETTGKSAIDA